MALALDGGNVQALQPLIGQGQWHDETWLWQHWRLVDETLGAAAGGCLVAGSDLPQPGAPSVGVARQGCGRLGKGDHCQAGVCTAYASRQGETRLARRRYLPEAWCDAAHRERWDKGGIPAETACKTKQSLALERGQAVGAAGRPRVRWVTCDEALGRDGGFLDGVAALRRWYCAAVPHDTQGWQQRPATAVPAWSGRGRRPRKARGRPGEPAPHRVEQLAAPLPLAAWHPFLSTEGSTGPVVAEFACQRGVAGRAGWPGPDVWLVFRRGVGEGPELQGYRSNAPAHTPGAALVRMAGRRWPIDTALEESKGGVGVDHDEVRSWLGWHHHMTLCLLAHHFLVRTRERVKKGRQP